ncbi:MAG: Fe-S cluster assembly protein SufD [Ignavibacteriales bacterium]|nr:Fe-S cluster assembly protein SufD [Ignavibacteriales bacterium]
MTEISNPVTNYTEDFLKFEIESGNESKSEIQTLRQKAFEEFRSAGFPTNKDEEWRFTNPSRISKIHYNNQLKNKTTVDIKKQLDNRTIQEYATNRLVFVDGIYSTELSNLKSSSAIIVSTLSEMLSKNPRSVIDIAERLMINDKTFFNSLNTAFMRDGAFISIPDETTVATPIYLIFIATNDPSPFVMHPRNIITLGRNSEATIIEHYISVSNNVYFTNVVSDIILDKEARLEHTKLQAESVNAIHIGSTYFNQSESSKLKQNTIMIGGAIGRNNLISKLNSENIECTFNGLSLGEGDQLIDNHTTIDHAMPHCESHELYKSILSGKSRGVFNGKIFVRKDAQKTNAKQTNRTLLLSDETTMDIKPQLEIFADDVKCTHGATIGYLDADAIFYLRSRGISENTARDILTHAFANDIIARISSESVRDYLSIKVHDKLKQRL